MLCDCIAPLHLALIKAFCADIDGSIFLREGLDIISYTIEKSLPNRSSFNLIAFDSELKILRRIEKYLNKYFTGKESLTFKFSAETQERKVCKAIYVLRLYNYLDAAENAEIDMFKASIQKLDFCLVLMKSHKEGEAIGSNRRRIFPLEKERIIGSLNQLHASMESYYGPDSMISRCVEQLKVDATALLNDNEHLSTEK